MKVIIAEKPSVAREIARVIRATNKKEGYIEGGDYAVTWALGHLITAAMPEATASRVSTKITCRFFLPSLPLFPVKSRRENAIKQTLLQSPNSKSSKNSSGNARALS